MNSMKGRHTDEEIEESFRKAQKARKKQKFHWCDVIMILGLLVLVVRLDLIWNPIYELLRQIQVPPFVAVVIGLVATLAYCFFRISPAKLMGVKREKMKKVTPEDTDLYD